MSSSVLKDLLNTIPVNVERLIKSEGITLNKNATKEEIGRGINRYNIGEIKKSGEEYQILILGSDHYYRKRFTMAHELGHYILHKEKIDKFGAITDSEEYKAEGITPEEEAAADAFAAETLMPEEEVRKIFEETMKNQSNKEEETIEEMSKMFQVSKPAMKLRLYLLELIKNY
jgi:Zn-dependent peptidase ImmA (M78 family)